MTFGGEFLGGGSETLVNQGRKMRGKSWPRNCLKSLQAILLTKITNFGAAQIRSYGVGSNGFNWILTGFYPFSAVGVSVDT